MSTSFVFDAVLYAISIASVLALYGSTLPRKAPATVPTAAPAPAPVAEPIAPPPSPSDDVTLADFATVLCPDSPELDEEVLSFIDGLLAPAPVPMVEDTIVPFTRRKHQPSDGLENMGVRALRQIASELKISKYSRKSKAALIAEIRSIRAAA